MKACSCCGIDKPADEFQVRRASKDGLTSSCKDCLKKRDRARYLKEKDYRRAKGKEYMRTDAGRNSHALSVRKWRDNNKVRRAAHVILNNALRKGVVEKLPCFICGGHAEAHHPDYDRPLDVTWLCNKHHNEIHLAHKRGYYEDNK